MGGRDGGGGGGGGEVEVGGSGGGGGQEIVGRGGGGGGGGDGVQLLNDFEDTLALFLSRSFSSFSSFSAVLQNLCSTSSGMKEASVPTLWTGLDSTNPR